MKTNIFEGWTEQAGVQVEIQYLAGEKITVCASLTATQLKPAIDCTTEVQAKTGQKFTEAYLNSQTKKIIVNDYNLWLTNTNSASCRIYMFSFLILKDCSAIK